MILPVISFTYVSLAYYGADKANMEEVFARITFQQAKGLGPVKIMIICISYCLIPFVTLLGLSLPALLGRQ